MRDLLYHAEVCKRELDSLGIKYGNIVEFRVNTRAKKRWGQCKSVPGGYSININVALLEDTSNLKSLKETIHHELLHTCPGCFNHGARWKNLANRVNAAYGYNIKRTSTTEEKGIECDVPQIKYNYTIQCKECGQIIHRQRNSKLIQYPEKFRCGVCGGKLIKIA